MKRFIKIPVRDLKSDMAVDLAHVEDLAQSMKAMEQLSPILLWQGDWTIIDGFHRVAALEKAGIEEAECLEVDCTDEEF